MAIFVRDRASPVLSRVMVGTPLWRTASIQSVVHIISLDSEMCRSKASHRRLVFHLDGNLDRHTFTGAGRGDVQYTV